MKCYQCGNENQEKFEKIYDEAHSKPVSAGKWKVVTLNNYECLECGYVLRFRTGKKGGKKDGR